MEPSLEKIEISFHLIREVINYYFHPQMKFGTDYYEILRCLTPTCHYLVEAYSHLVTKALSIHFISECQVIESGYSLELWFPSIPDKFWARIGKYWNWNYLVEKSLELKEYNCEGKAMYRPSPYLKEMVSLVAPFTNSPHICLLEPPNWIFVNDPEYISVPHRKLIEKTEPIRNQYDRMCRGEKFQGFSLTKHLMKVRANFEGMSKVHYSRTKKYLRHFRGPSVLEKPKPKPAIPCSILCKLDSKTDLSIFCQREVIIIHNTVEPLDLYHLLRLPRNRSSVIQLVYARIAEVDEGLLRELKKILSPSLRCIKGVWVPDSTISEIFPEEYHKYYGENNPIRRSDSIIQEVLWGNTSGDISPTQILQLCNEYKIRFDQYYFDHF